MTSSQVITWWLRDIKIYSRLYRSQHWICIRCFFNNISKINGNTFSFSIYRPSSVASNSSMSNSVRNNSTSGSTAAQGGSVTSLSASSYSKYKTPLKFCTKVIYVQRDAHPTLLAALESIADQVHSHLKSPSQAYISPKLLWCNFIVWTSFLESLDSPPVLWVVFWFVKGADSSQIVVRTCFGEVESNLEGATGHCLWELCSW